MNWPLLWFPIPLVLEAFLFLADRPKATLFSLCFVHFKGWGWGPKGKHGNAAFKSLMCHIVPFRTSPCLCQPGRLRNGGQPHEMRFWIKFSWILDFSSFVPLKFVFQKFIQLEKGSELKANWNDTYYTYTIPPVLVIEPSTWQARRLFYPGAVLARLTVQSQVLKLLCSQAGCELSIFFLPL